MQSRSFIACRGAVGLVLVLVAGTLSAQQAPTDLLPGFVDDKVDAQLQPVQEPQPADAMGVAVDPGELADLRGGTQTVENDILVNGLVEDNVADDVLTGNNSLTGGSFANSSGISTVIQNTGANVLIQNAMIVNVKFAGSGP